MTYSNLCSLLFIAGITVSADSALAQQPTDVVTSDAAFNTAMGTNALLRLSGGSGGNTAAGAGSLAFNTTGGENTAVGYVALWNNTTGNFNTAVGGGALLSNIGGSNNTASGFN